MYSLDLKIHLAVSSSWSIVYLCFVFPSPVQSFPFWFMACGVGMVIKLIEVRENRFGVSSGKHNMSIWLLLNVG